MIFFIAQGIKLDTTSTTFRMEMESPIFADRDKVIPPNFSYPVDIILDEKARKLFAFQDLPSAATIFREIEDVQLYIKGTPFMTGKLLLVAINRQVAKCSFATNNLAKVADLKLTELDLGKYDLPPVPPGDIRSHMTATTLNPDLFNHIFFPVYNPSYYDQEFYDQQLTKISKSPDPALRENFFYRRCQNAFKNTNFLYDDDHCYAITPFVKLHYIYKKIFDFIGIDYIDQFWDAELKKLYLYNNNSLNSILGSEQDATLKNGMNSEIVYTAHVPDIKAIDLIKDVNTIFTVALIPGIFKKTFKLRYIRDIVRDSQKADWSSRVVSIDADYSGDEFSEIGYDEDSSDGYFTNPSERTVPSGSEIVHEEPTNLWRSVGNFFWFFKFKTLFYSKKGQKILSKLSPLFTASPVMLDGAYNTINSVNNIAIDNKEFYAGDPQYKSLPVINTKGTIAYVFTNDQKKKVPKTQSSKLSPRLLFYRGYHQAVVQTFDYKTFSSTTKSVTFPFASENIYKPHKHLALFYDELPTKHSLLWSGKHGLHEKAKPYYDLIKDGRIIRAKLILHITDFLNFEWDSKIKVMSNNYLIKKLSIEVLPDGSLMTDLHMIRTI